MKSLTGDIFGYFTESPALTNTYHYSLSLFKNLRAATACAVQKLAEAEGYSGWSPVPKYGFHWLLGISLTVPLPGPPQDLTVLF